MDDAGRRARLLAWAVYAALICLWAEAAHANVPRVLNAILGHAPRGMLAHLPVAFFIAREAVWWFVAAVMGGVVFCYLRQMRARLAR